MDAIKRPKAPDVKTFVAIKALGPEKMLFIQDALRKGASAWELAKIIKEEWGNLKNTKEDSLAKMLLRYKKKELFDPVRASAFADKAVQQDLVRRTKNIFDVLAEMEWLAAEQRKRLIVLFEKEASMKLPFNWTRNEISQYQDQLEAIKKTQFDLGIVSFKGPLPAGTVTVKMNPNDMSVGITLGDAVSEALKVIEADYINVSPE